MNKAARKNRARHAGHARALSLSPRRRREIAKAAAGARWGKKLRAARNGG